MKKLFICLSVFFIINYGMGQSSADLNTAPKPETDANKQDISTKSISLRDFPTFGLNGLGNVNTETFTNLNAGGKLAGYIRPVKTDYSLWTVNFSFNVNASNSDSLLAGTFLFPDVGRSSFYSLVEFTQRYFFGRKKSDSKSANNKTDIGKTSINTTVPANNIVKDTSKTDVTTNTNNATENLYLASPFLEFANKNIKAEKNDSVKIFSTLSYTFGIRFQYMFLDNKDKVSFSIAPFYSIINVPDEDNEDYRFLFTSNSSSTLRSAVRSWGVKIGFQYNNFQIFADLRNVLGDEKKIPIRELRGFNSNIGVVFNAQVFEK